MIIWVVELMVVFVILKEDDVNVEFVVFFRVEDVFRSEIFIVEIFIYFDDGKWDIVVIWCVKFEVEFDKEIFIIEDEIGDM